MGLYIWWDCVSAMDYSCVAIGDLLVSPPALRSNESLKEHLFEVLCFLHHLFSWQCDIGVRSGIGL